MGLLDYFNFKSEGSPGSFFGRAADAAYKGLNKFKGIVSAPLKWIGRTATEMRIQGESNPVADAVSREHSRWMPNDFHDQVESALPITVTSIRNGKPVYS
jgi:hypothetical protein